MPRHEDYIKDKEKYKRLQKKYYLKNRDKYRGYVRKWQMLNKERKREHQRKSYYKNIVKEHLRDKIYRILNRDKRNAYMREKNRNDLHYHINQNMGKALHFSLKKKKDNKKWQELVGYTLIDLINHLEKQFTSTMNWDNYGSYWHVDHIRPKSWFKFSSPNEEEFKKCWSLKNLQPLERFKNYIKNNHYEG